MERKNILAASVAAITIVIIFVIVFSFYQMKVREDYLFGLWVSPDDFNERAGISSMRLFIGKYNQGRRKAYLLINNHITNQLIDIKYYPRPTLGCSREYILRPTIEFSAEEMFPRGVKFSLNMVAGKLVIYDDEMVYAVLYKNNDITDVFARAA